jgi:hypothetical protein
MGAPAVDVHGGRGDSKIAENLNARPVVERTRRRCGCTGKIASFGGEFHGVHRAISISIARRPHFGQSAVIATSTSASSRSGGRWIAGTGI